MRLPKALRRIRRDTRGATLIEFAIVSPVMLLLIMGLCDLCYRAYAQSILTGAVQRSARDATIEGSADSLDTLDARVFAAVKQVSQKATWSSTRKTYRAFADVAPEPFTDSNGNNKYDMGECFSDINGNKVWDADPGKTGQGNANDVTVYTMTVNYPRLFPLQVAGFTPMQTISAKTILKNQPYGVQATSDPVTICS